MKKQVHIVHSVDTEGPLYESLEATFGRLREIFGVNIEPTAENLKKIQNREIEFGEKTDIMARVLDSHYLNYNDSWEKVDKMLTRIMSPEFRNKLRDSFGGGWVYNWHCVDHVGYSSNPRRRELGMHKIFDHYREMVKNTGSFQDGIHWHFHPMSIYKEAHRSATSYINSPYLYEILCRRIIERNWFPTVSRAGFHSERPDSHWFLEQWIPFDLSNWAYCEEDDSFASQSDIAGGRFGDWRLAPDDWSIYRPSHDNYQLPGNCRRWIARGIDIKSRGRELTDKEVEKAFSHAGGGKATIMGITSHDFRDIAHDIDFAREKIIKASGKYPEVKFKFCEAVEAFNSAIYEKDTVITPLELELSLEGDDRRLILKVEAVRGNVFGPQPFLAVKTKSGRFIHDSFDFDISRGRWSYTFDDESIRANDVDTVGVASCDKYGNVFVEVIKKTAVKTTEILR